MSRSINALGMMSRIQGLIEKATPSIEHYQEVLNDKDVLRVQPEMDQYYRTFDGSIVLVNNRRQAIKSVAKMTVIEGDGDEFLGASLNQILHDLVGGNIDDGDVPAEMGEQFLCTVIKGGHGVKSVPGDSPGASYIVDEDGLTVFAAKADENDLDCNINLGYLSLVGLCLREKVKATFEGSQ